MKGKDIIAHVISAEMPDMEQLRLSCIEKAATAADTKRNMWSLAPVAVCAVLLFAMFMALPYLRDTAPYSGYDYNSDSGFLANNNDDSMYQEQENSYACNQQYEAQAAPTDDILPPPEFIGLPMDNHCLPVENHMASRYGVGSLLDIFGSSNHAVASGQSLQAFAFVRVVETTQEGRTQISSVEVLRTVWSSGRELPDTMTLTQFSGAIMCCAPYGELMREGGVFLLPLWYNDGTADWHEIGWFSWTYFDVLFEVDNNGLVWSRSNFSAFNRFDGRHTSVLTNAILGIASGNENLGRDIAHSPLGWAADEGVLAIVTAVASESRELFPGSAGREIWINHYTVHVEEILSMPTAYGLKRGGWFEHQRLWRENWQVNEQWWQNWEHDNVIMAVNYTRELLEANERYLVFIAPSYSGWSAQFTFFWESAARINPDGTITPVFDVEDNGNVFDEYDGFTVERLAQLAHLANTWHESYSFLDNMYDT